MHSYTTTVRWTRDGNDLGDGKYCSAHEWAFDGGAVVPASAAPGILPPPGSDPAGVDPEEALVAAASSCHMLFFLFFASRDGFTVQDYRDAAEGVMERGEDGRTGFTVIRLKPEIAWTGSVPDAEALAALHERAHEACFIANSIKARVEIAAP